MADQARKLRYLEAAKVETPVARLDQLRPLSPSQQVVGSFEGVLIHPEERKVRYFVVASRQLFRNRRYLLPVKASRIDSVRRAVCVDIEPDELTKLPHAHPSAFQPFSDDDLIAALLSPHAA